MQRFTGVCMCVVGLVHNVLSIFLIAKDTAAVLLLRLLLADLFIVGGCVMLGLVAIVDAIKEVKNSG